MKAGLSRRSLISAVAALAALGPESVPAEVDRRNAQTQWTLQRINAHDTSGVILVRIFHGYFPLPGHLVLDAGAPPYRFVNFERQYQDDTRDGAAIVSKLAGGAQHELVAWVRRERAVSKILRYGLVIERRDHGPPAPGAPQTRSVIFSDKTDFICIVGPIALLWEYMLNAYVRLPRLG